jgi:hypothetical protein
VIFGLKTAPPAHGAWKFTAHRDDAVIKASLRGIAAHPAARLCLFEARPARGTFGRGRLIIIDPVPWQILLPGG